MPISGHWEKVVPETRYHNPPECVTAALYSPASKIQLTKMQPCLQVICSIPEANKSGGFGTQVTNLRVQHFAPIGEKQYAVFVLSFKTILWGLGEEVVI